MSRSFGFGVDIFSDEALFIKYDYIVLGMKNIELYGSVFVC